MQIELKLPELAESMTDGTLTTWLKKEGDWVTAGEAVALIETEKSSVELESPQSGVLRRILVSAGTEKVRVGEALALIDTGLSASSDEAFAVAESEPIRRVSALPTDFIDPVPLTAAASSPLLTEEVVPSRENVVEATPLAQRIATLAGLDLTQVKGSGPNTRICKRDVERSLRERRGVATSLTRPKAQADVKRSRPTESAAPFEVRGISATRKVIATRLLQSKQGIPHFYLRVECDVDGMMDFRRRANTRSSGVRFTVTDFVIRAIALALKKVPLANASWAGDAIHVHENADVAVAVNTPTGLITPIIRGADGKTLAAISRELRLLGERARAGQLAPDEYTGGTFTVSNLGMFGVDSLYAIINPPQSGILGVGAIRRRPVVRGEDIVVGHQMTCTLSADHRTIDGAAGADLLAEFRTLIEDPWLLVF